MNIQHERINQLCERLNLTTMASHYSVQAQCYAEQQATYSDFLEQLLSLEEQTKQGKSRTTY